MDDIRCRFCGKPVKHSDPELNVAPYRCATHGWLMPIDVNHLLEQHQLTLGEASE